MSSKYFNKYEFNKACELQYSNPLKSKELFEIYFSKYPNDYSSYPFYVSVLISLNEIDKAQKLYDYLENMFIKNSYNDDRRFKYFKYGMFINKIKLYFQQGKYEEILNYYNYIKDEFSGEIHSVIFYCLYKTGKINTLHRNDNSYLCRQIMDYSEEEFRNHINKHLLLPNEDNYNNSIFVKDFPVDNVINEIKKIIPNNNRILTGFVADFYYFKYDDCGKNKYKYTDYFKATCVHNTGDIITLCPCDNSENLPYIDLNYLKERDNVKVKSLSQIDKFMLRYNKK